MADVRHAIFYMTESLRGVADAGIGERMEQLNRHELLQKTMAKADALNTKIRANTSSFLNDILSRLMILSNPHVTFEEAKFKKVKHTFTEDVPKTKRFIDTTVDTDTSTEQPIRIKISKEWKQGEQIELEVRVVKPGTTREDVRVIAESMLNGVLVRDPAPPEGFLHPFVDTLEREMLTPEVVSKRFYIAVKLELPRYLEKWIKLMKPGSTAIYIQAILDQVESVFVDYDPPTQALKRFGHLYDMLHKLGATESRDRVLEILKADVVDDLIHMVPLEVAMKEDMESVAEPDKHKLQVIIDELENITDQESVWPKGDSPITIEGAATESVSPEGDSPMQMDAREKKKKKKFAQAPKAPRDKRSRGEPRSPMQPMPPTTGKGPTRPSVDDLRRLRVPTVRSLTAQLGRAGITPLPKAPATPKPGELPRIGQQGLRF
jgi:hypothetical protein